MAAEAVASVVVEHVVSIIERQFLKEVNLVRGVGEKIISLSDELKTIRNVLDDAEKKGADGDKAVLAWLKKLENASYELEEVSDEWYTSLREFQIQQEQKREVYNYTSFISIPSYFHRLAVRRDISKKLDKVKQKIDSILVEKDLYHLVQTATPLSSTNDWRVQSTSFVDLSEIYGRDAEREDLVRRVTLALLHEGDQTNHIQIFSIVGVGGVGKTTLGQLVYNDTRVRECFQLRIWICVSEPFDEVRVAKAIIKSVTKISSDSDELEDLLQRLKECISGKKFLLVMDDVWTGDSSKWKPLITSLKNGNMESKILVTTRNEWVAEMIGSRIHHLNELSEEACWLLLQRTALSGRDEGEWKRFENVGMKIANKCKGLPLAAKVLGSLLSSKKSLDEWENVLNSEIWQLEEANEVFRHLRLSYNELSPSLKRCFSYCGVFPKDTGIDVEELIQHWMAVGYLGSDGSDAGDMELRGREYFNKLAMRCLFQDFEKDAHLDGQIVYCKMHDIVHDFALSLRENIDEEAGIKKSSSACKVCSPAALISRAKTYRSFGNCWEPHRFLCDCVANIRMVNLRALDNQRILNELERFIHLRWLDLSWNSLIAKDMKTICRLYNLQTLLLHRCDLEEITGHIGNLIHLRHLDLSNNYSLKGLPREIENLIHLRHLNLSSNELAAKDIKTICQLYNLETLLLKKCNLKEITGEIGNLTHLRYFDLSDNWHLKKLPREIVNLIHLRHLRLSRNISMMELPREIENLIHLRHLNLSSNELAAEDMKTICRLYNLQTLLLVRCDLKEITGEIGNLIHLRQLDLSRNRSLKELPREIGNLIHLRHLKLSGNISLKKLPREIGNLIQLRHLNLSRNESLDELPCEIGNLIHLKHLDLSGNESLKELPREIGNLIQVRHLNLSWNTSLKELPREIENLIQLKHLNLHGNEWE